MTAEPLPDDATLRRFLLGDLPPAELEAVGRGLDAHPHAAATLAGLIADDTLLSALRSPADAPDAPDVAAAAARAAGLVAPDLTGDATEADPADDLLAALAPAEAPGELGRLGGYRVLRLLGRGGMGAVFEAADDRLGRRVALKVMLPALAARAGGRQRFLREAKAAAAVEHDHIVPIYQTGEDRGVPFLAMPLLAGETLDDRLKAGPLPAADVLRVGREVAEGLAAAHAAGLVHRDIKPSNVWLTGVRSAECGVRNEGTDPHSAFGRVRILDFGLARSAAGADGLTQSGAVLGTPAYMAPEQARGEAVDARADLFSLGVVLYHAATGRRPFQGSDTFSILTALATTEPPPAATVNPAVPARLSALISRLLAKNPTGRPQSARAVADELARHAAEPARESATQVVGVAAAPFGGGDTTEVFAPAPRRRRWRVAAAVLFVAAAGLAVANGPTIVRVVSNEGELVVEVDDANTEVVVKGGAVELRREDGGKKRVYLVTATKAGEVEVREPGSTDVLVTEKFQLRRGGDVLVKVTAEKLAAARAPKAIPTASPTADPDRRLAAWVKGLGGNVEVTVDTPGQRHYCGPGTHLPAEPFKVTSLRVSFEGKQATIRPEDIELFRGVAEIKGIDLDNPGITNETLPRLINLLPESLELFTISGSPNRPPLGDAAFAGITRFRNLRRFDVWGVPLTDAACEFLRPHTGLKVLEIWSTKITDRGMSRLTGFASVERLGLPAETGDESARPFLATGKLERLTLGKHCTPAVLPLVATNRALTVLSGIPRDTTDADLVHLKSLTLLEGLDLQNTQVAGSALAEFQGRPAIVGVNLEGAKTTDESLVHLKGFPNLRGVYLTGKTVTDVGVGHVAAVGTLTEMRLNYTAVTDAGLEAVARMKALRYVVLYHTKVTEAGVTKLAAALPACRIEWDGGTVGPTASPAPEPLSAAERAALGWVLANGGHLELRTPAGAPLHLRPGSQLPDGPVRITGVSLGDASKHTEAALLDAFRGLPAGVLGVQLNYAPLTDAGLETLVGLPSMRALESFHASGVRITDDGVRHLRKLPRLRIVGVGYTRVTSAGLAHLRGLPLAQLEIHSTLVDDAAMPQVAEFRDLDMLNLAGSRVTASGMASLRTLPKLNVLHLGGSTATAAALEQAAGCPGVGFVAVSAPSADAVAVFNRFPRLDSALVEWPSAPIPAGVVEALAVCKRLKVVDLGTTRVTRPEAERLAAAMPWCEVKWAGGTIAPTASPAPLAPAQRAALEWVLAGGGSLRVALDGVQRPLTAPERVPDGPLAVVQVQVPPGTGDAGVENLKAIPVSAEGSWLLDARGSTITHAGLARLVTFPAAAALDQLCLSETPTTDAGLEQVKRLGKLWNLDLRNTRVTDAGLAHVRDLPLKHLDLAGCGGVTGTGFVHLRGMTTLRTLDIYRCPVPGERLAELAGLKLESFSAANCRDLGDAGLTHLTAVVSLQSLGLSVTNVTDEGVKGVRTLRALKSLDLGYNPGVTDACAAALAGLPALESLTLARTGLTDRGLADLAGCASLAALDVRATAVTAAGVRAFAAARPACKVRWDGAAGEARP